MRVFLGYFLVTVKFNLSLDVILERSMYWMKCSLLSAATDSDVIKLYDLTSICQQVWLVLYEDSRLCPHYARGIWKRSFISTVWLTVHTNSSRKRSYSTAGIWKRRLCVLLWTKNILEKKNFSKTMTSRWSRDFPARVFFKHKFKLTGDCCIFKFIPA